MSSAQTPRTQREIERDAGEALSRMYRGAGAATWCAIVFALVALWIAYDERDWRLGAGAAVLVTLILGLAFWVRRGSQLASVGLVAAFAGSVAFVWFTSEQLPGVLAFAVLGYRLWQGMVASFDLAELRKEFAAVYEPRGIQAGDLYSVEQGGQYAVVKVLAFDPGAPDLIHLRLFGRRYRARPQSVGGRADRDAEPGSVAPQSSGSRTAYPHLPVPIAEFARWLPVLVRHEPVGPSELDGYLTWRRVQFPDGARAG